MLNIDPSVLEKLTPLQKQQLFDYLIKNDFRHFITAVFYHLNPQTVFEHSWHLDLLAYELMRTLDPKTGLNPAPQLPRTNRLIINVPPRSLKSIVVNVAYRCFVLGHMPHERFLSASYSGTLSEKFNADCISVINSTWYQRIFPKTILVKENVAKFTTTAQGHSIATSTGGTATGEGGDFLIADDILNPKQAASPVERNTCLTWLPNTFMNRINDKAGGGTIILVMQRLHEDDPTGFLLAENDKLPEGYKWRLIKLPQVAEEREEWHYYGQTHIREEGDPLNPRRDTKRAIEAAKVEFGGMLGWATQCQQRPAPKDGGILQASMLQAHNLPTDPSAYTSEYTTANGIYLYQSWDTAIKDTAQADWSVCTTWAVTATHYNLIDIYRTKLDYPSLRQAISDQATKYLTAPTAILIEDKASGQQLIQELQNTTHLPIISIKASSQRDRKIISAAACSYPIESGRLRVPADKAALNWWDAFEHELTFFPKGKHDDQVDSMSQFINWIQLNGFNQYRIRTA